MQNKHRNFFHFKVSQLPGSGWGGPPVGPKDQLLPKKIEGFSIVFGWIGSDMDVWAG